MNTWKMALMAALTITVLWLLQPGKDVGSRPGLVEITFMGPGGALSSPLEEAVREFERRSLERHKKDVTKPAYRVVSGQNASRDRVADPTRFLVSVAGGMPPDVIHFDRFAVSEWAARGAFEPLDDYLERDLKAGDPNAIRKADFYASAWDESVYRDPNSGEAHIYGVPNNMDSRALFYNKDMLVRAGFVDSAGRARPPQTWEELERMGMKLTEKDENGSVKRIGFIPNYGNSFLYIYGWMNGGRFMSEDGRTVSLNDPKVVGALDWMTNMYDRLGGAKEVYAFQAGFQGGTLDPFMIGKVGMKIDGVWILAQLAEFGRFLNWGASPPPVPQSQRAKGIDHMTWVGGWCYAIPSTARHKEGAWELIRFLSSWDGIKLMAEAEHLNATSQGRTFVPRQHPNKQFNNWLTETYVNKPANTDPKIKKAVKVMNDLLEGAKFRPVTSVGQLMWNQQVTATEEAIFKKRTPQEALDRANANVQRKLDKALAPPKGVPVNWKWVIGLYFLLIALLCVGVYYWDTRVGTRIKIASLFGEWGRKNLIGTGAEYDLGSGPQARKQWRDALICVSPWIIGMVVFTGGPILFSVIISFSEYDILNPARFIGFGNYGFMFLEDPLFWKSLWNTIYMAIGIPAGMVVSLGMALLLNLKVKGVALWRTFFYLPSIVPAVAGAILWIWIFNPSGGLLNNILASFGIDGPNWLQDENTSKISLIIMGVWGAGGGMIIWLAGLKNINQAYYEAASIDGANTLEKFWHVTLPMLSPYILFNLVMGLIGTFQIFTPAFIMTAGGPVDSTRFYVYYLFDNAFRYLQMGYASAMAWLLFLIVFALTLLQLHYSKKWVHFEGE